MDLLYGVFSYVVWELRYFKNFFFRSFINNGSDSNENRTHNHLVRKQTLNQFE